MLLLHIYWDVDPIIVHIGNFGLHWYSVCFALAFILGNYLFAKIYQRENKPAKDLDTLLIYMVIGTVVGARLGHCFFYDPIFYLNHPIEILKTWRGGLASHGAAIGILTALYVYSSTRKDQPWLYVVDRMVIVVALGGALIRIGNLMNSEIVGTPTDVPWAFVFPRNNPQYPIVKDLVPRHPAQLYEAIFYLLVFIFLYRRYWKHPVPPIGMEEGKSLGWFLILVFGFRFLVEFSKEVQEEFEIGLPLHMGQWLSIPLILLGLYLLLRKQPLASHPAN
jgi:prolipoprotein diacylglyceryl transferase